MWRLLTCDKKKNMTQLIDRTESNLNTLFQWFCHHRMKVNQNKTQMLVIGTPTMLKDISPVTISFNGSQIQDSKVIRNLGVMVDRHLKYQSHIDALRAYFKDV